MVEGVLKRILYYVESSSSINMDKRFLCVLDNGIVGL